MDIGAQIHGQYSVIEHIGRGGMADVWSARDTRLRRMVAIKTIAAGLATDIDPIALFRQEAQTIAQLEHPHILPIYDFGEYEGRLYIVMRYVTGGSLEARLQQDKLSISEVLRISQAIASALDYAHAHDVIHLDLKPPNILLDSSGVPYLADFGLATVLDREGRARNPGSGTLLYMAPEQITSDTLDFRADIYAFGIMLYHMLAGRLPFDGSQPLAIRQLQYNDLLPDFEEESDYPSGVIDLLRQATARDPKTRPDSHSTIVEGLSALLQAQSATLGFALGGLGNYADELSELDAALVETQKVIGVGDGELLEAVDLFSRARHNWAGGQGRFLLGLTHFMLVCGVYQDAQRYGLTLDEVGKQLLLRGALEYDYERDFWWAHNDDAARRLVCLHTVRTGGAPARIRALFHLETLPDDPRQPIIPRLVAQALEIETDEQARISALQVLATRAKIVHPEKRYAVLSEYRGRLLTSLTRLGIHLRSPEVWQDAIYSPEIDLLVAHQALDANAPRVAEAAARTIGQMRSLTAVRYLANAQKKRRPGALTALALIRDAVPHLPPDVSPQARAYAWLANSLRRLMEHPLEGIARFALVWLGAWIAFGQQVYITYRSQALFTPARWGNTLAIGLVMGLFAALTVLFADEFNRRLAGFWRSWTRALVFLPLGILLGTLTWAGFSWFYLGGPVTWDLARMGGIGLALGFGISALLNLRGIPALFLATASVYLPIYASYRNQCHQLYLCFGEDGNLLSNFSPAPAILLGILAGGWVGARLHQRLLESVDRSQGGLEQNLQSLSTYLPLWLGRGLLAGVAALLVLGTWAGLALILQSGVYTWDEVSLLFGVPFVITLALTSFVGITGQIAFLGTGAALWWGIHQQVGTSFSQVTVAPYMGASYVEALFSYDQGAQVLSVGIPVAFTLALFAMLPSLYQGISQWIGHARHAHEERDGWTSLTLGLVLFVGAVIAVFAPFSAHVAGMAALAWGGFGFVLFVLALATWRWARWGGIGLVASLAILVTLGALRDATPLIATRLIEGQALGAMGLWAGLLAIASVGSLWRAVWSGAVWATTLLFASLWTIFMPETSWMLLAASLMGAVCSAILPHWDALEAGHWRAPWDVSPARLRTASASAAVPSAPASQADEQAPAPTLVKTPPVPATLPVVTAPLPAKPVVPATQGLDLPDNAAPEAGDAPRIGFAEALPRPAVPQTLAFERPSSQANEAPPPADTPATAKPPSIKFDFGTTPKDTSKRAEKPSSAKPPSIKFDFGTSPKDEPQTKTPSDTDAPED